MTYHWTTPIRYVKGLGPVKARELTKLKINTVGDLLEYPPLHYIYPGGTSIADAKEGHVVIKAVVAELKRALGRGNIVEAVLVDQSGACRARWYNGAYMLQSLRPGITVTFWGKYKGGTLQQPKWTTIGSSMEDVYGGQYGVHHQTIRAALKEVLGNVELPPLYQGLSRELTFSMFHFPETKDAEKEALNTLKFDECLQMQLALAERRKGQRRRAGLGQRVSRVMKWDEQLDGAIISYFPYVRTFEQKRTMFTIARELCHKATPMQRLIHGEVGSGKTAVAFYAAMLAALNGKRTLILCPTTILAQQHYDSLKGMGWDDVSL